jgi:hypothetical protein
LTVSQYGSKTSLFSSKNPYTTIVDSGTTLIIMPPDDFALLYAKFKKELGSDTLICAYGICMAYESCSSISSKLLPLYFAFDDEIQFSVPPSEYLLDGSDFIGMQNTCIVGIMGMEFKTNFYILGDIFLKNYYSVYNFEDNSVGLGLSISSTAAISE